MSTLAASKVGIVSRSTLSSLRAGGRVPNYVTLSKLDDLLSWEAGSARATLYGQEPVAREKGESGRRPVDSSSSAALRRGHDDHDPQHYRYDELGKFVDERLAELGISKSRFAQVGGPGRSTMATLGKRGYAPSPETLSRIDSGLMWEPGSALAVLRGGEPLRRGPALKPHPSMVPLTAGFDVLKQMKARLSRQAQAIDQLQADLDTAMSHVGVVMRDLEDPRRRDAVESSGTGTPDEGAAGQEHNS